MNSINVEHISKFNIFLEENRFIDTVLHFQDTKLEAHSLILAQNCSWFNEKFSSPEQIEKDSSSIYHIYLPINPENSVQHLIKSIYSQKIELTMKTAIHLLKAADFYGCEYIAEKTSNFIERYLTEDNVLFIVQALSKYNLYKVASKICSGYVAKYIAEIYSNQMARKCTSIEEVLEYVLDAHVLQSILSQDVLNGKIPLIYKQVNKLSKTSPTGYENDVFVSLTNEQKAYIINLFAKDKQFSDDQKEVLTSIVDWTQENSDSFLINYQCDWISLKVARQKFNSIINKRKNALVEIEKLSSHSNKNFQNIPILFYISKVFQVENINTAEEINIYDQATTLCHIAKRLPPKYFSIINLSTTGLVLSDVTSIFEDDNSYLRILNEDQGGSVEIRTRFYVEPHKIDIFCDCKRDHSFYSKLVGKPYKYLPEIELSTYCDDELVSKQIAKFDSSILTDFEIEPKSKGINRIILRALESKLPQALRIRYINLKGVFIL